MANVAISLNNITLRVRDRHILENTSWTIREDEHWAVIGPNGSGKTSLVRSLVDEYFIVAGTTWKKKHLKKQSSVGYVSFEQQQDLYDYSEQKQHAFSFSGKEQEMTTAGYVLSAGAEEKMKHAAIGKIAGLLGITHLLTHNMLSLSNGEVRKVLLARSLVKKPLLLILDEPFEGLDERGRTILEESINKIIVSGACQVIMTTHRFEHLSSAITHVLCLKNCRVVDSGRKEKILGSPSMKSLFKKDRDPAKAAALKHSSARTEGSSVLVSMMNVHVSFGDTGVIDNFSWTVRNGENWIVSGPNGAGKSTILRLIFGDIPQVYANEVTVFGHRRGSGESLWDIRKLIGYLSPEYHMEYRKSVPIRDTILSGFYDSVGLFRPPRQEHVETATQWLSLLGFSERSDELLQHFSFGEQRLILLARALVKNPLLLILDEPLQGLDPANRELFLEIINGYGLSCSGTVLYITHHKEEIGSCFTNMLKINRSHDGFHFKTLRLKPNSQ